VPKKYFSVMKRANTNSADEYGTSASENSNPDSNGTEENETGR
jgi:hypothetical protein